MTAGSPDVRSPRRDADERRADDAAVLFVHGIGWQTPGGTLRAFAPPLVAALGDFADRNARAQGAQEAILTGIDIRRPDPFGRQERGLVRVARACASPGNLRSAARWLRGELFVWREPPRGQPPTSPAHAECRITVRDGPTAGDRRWLLAESCWARSFPRPRGSRLAIWLIRILPWIALFQLAAVVTPYLRPHIEAGAAENLSRARFMMVVARMVPRVLAAYAALLLRVLGVLLAAALVVPLIVLSFLPVLRWITVGAIGLIGDSYAAVVDPPSRDAMVAKIRSDIDWCLQRSERLVVVAHSQGAMLTRTALSERPFGDRVTFVGLGSGLGPLHSLGRAHDERVGGRGWLVLLLAVSAIASLATGLLLFTTAFLVEVQDMMAILRAFWDQTWATAEQAVRCSSQEASCPPPEFVMPDDMASKPLGWIVSELPAWGVFAVTMAISYLVALLARRAGLYDVFMQMRDELRLPAGSVGRWIEFSSRYDPVSCGPLLVGCADEVIDDIVNGPVLAAEHGGYRRNAQVRLRVAEELARITRRPVQIAHASVAADLLRAEARRRKRCRLALRAQLAVSYAVVAVAGIWLVAG
jgi:hypothetical protein